MASHLISSDIIIIIITTTQGREVGEEVVVDVKANLFSRQLCFASTTNSTQHTLNIDDLATLTSQS